jgi:glucose-1-phosphate thymidylyltransferase
VKALILAAGYATRLSPLTDDFPKGLLPVGGRPIVDWIVENVHAAGIHDVQLVTNARFAPLFDEWSKENGVTIADDGTDSNENRLGAIGDIRFAALDDDALIIAGDNLFDYALADLIAFWREKGSESAVAVHDVGTRELARQYGIVDVDAADRIISFVEKPEVPPSTLAATATYLYSKAHLALVDTYLNEGNAPDQPGNYVAWLHRREPVFAYRFGGGWYDIGDRGQLLEADNRLRERLGLPLRTSYTLDN